MRDRGELSARTGFSAFRLDRRAAWRDDAARLDALFAAPEARALLIAGETPILARAGGGLTAWHRPTGLAALEPRARVFLGTEGEAPRFALGVAAEVAPQLKESAAHQVNDLRSIALQGLVPPEEIGALAAGKALVDWHMRHGFCARCGAPSAPASGGWRRDCPACGAQHFPRTDPVVIMLPVRGERCLMARQARFMPGMYSALAGFVEPGETIEDAVRREVLEETGVRTGRVRYLASQPWPFPSSLMIGCLAEALDDDIVLDSEELEAGRWFHRDEVLVMMRREHPDGIFTSPRLAIASTLVWAWAIRGEEA